MLGPAGASPASRSTRRRGEGGERGGQARPEYSNAKPPFANCGSPAATPGRATGTARPEKDSDTGGVTNIEVRRVP